MTPTRLLTPLLVLLLATLVTQVQATDLPDIQERGTLKIAVYNNFPPYSYEVSGNAAGIDVEISQMIAEKLGLQPVIRLVGADENVGDDLRNNVWKGHYMGGGVADIMLHTPYDREYAEEEDQVEFLAPYFLENIVFAIDTKKLGNKPTIASFRYDKIGAEIDTLSDFYLLSAVGGTIRPNVVHYRNISEAVDALRSGEISAVMGPRGEIEGALKDQPKDLLVTRIVTPGLSRASWAVGIAVKQGRPLLASAVNQAMAELSTNGEIQKVFESHGVNYIAPAKP